MPVSVFLSQIDSIISSVSVGVFSSDDSDTTILFPCDITISSEPCEALRVEFIVNYFSGISEKMEFLFSSVKFNFILRMMFIPLSSSVYMNKSSILSVEKSNVYVLCWNRFR